MKIIEKVDGSYDAVIVGSGFGSTFFLHQFLKYAPADARILVIERGRKHSHAEQLDMGTQSSIDQATTYDRIGDPGKTWNFTVAFGGGSNCWWANSYRQHPSDFTLKSTYGVGRDWPVRYEDLEAYYIEVEDLMQISGPVEDAPWLRKGPYPLPPHQLPLPDRMMMERQPGFHFPVSTARPSIDTATRPKCCTNGVCHLCPIDSKFTIQNSFMTPYEDPRVEVLLEAEVRSLDVTGRTAQKAVFRRGGASQTVAGDLFVLGANGVFNPIILMRSGLDHPQLGRNLHEQYALFGEVHLDGIDHFQGSTVVNGLNYSHYDGPFRKDEASVLIETWNLGRLRSDHGKWRQVIPFLMKIEDLPQEKNRVEPGESDESLPKVIFEGYSENTLKTAACAQEIVEKIFSPLPVEGVVMRSVPGRTSSHLHGTTVMGTNPKDSLIDADQIHHTVRNLVVVGGGGFPTGSQSNPTLTISAMAMKAADKLSKPA